MIAYTPSTYSTYESLDKYYRNTWLDEPIKKKKVKIKKPEKVHVFDIKDLDLKEE